MSGAVEAHPARRLPHHFGQDPVCDIEILAKLNGQLILAFWRMRSYISHAHGSQLLEEAFPNPIGQVGNYRQREQSSGPKHHGQKIPLARRKQHPGPTRPPE